MGSGHVFHCTLAQFDFHHWPDGNLGIWRKMLTKAKIYLCYSSIKRTSLKHRGWGQLLTHRHSVLELVTYLNSAFHFTQTPLHQLKLNFQYFKYSWSSLCETMKVTALLKAMMRSSLWFWHREGSVNRSDLYIPHAWWLDILKNGS